METERIREKKYERKKKDLTKRKKLIKYGTHTKN